MNELNNKQFKALHAALMDAYRDYTALKMMLKFNLDIELAQIASESKDLASVVFDVIEWFSSRGQLQELIISAHQANPQNGLLKTFVETVGLGQTSPVVSAGQDSPISTSKIGTVSPTDPDFQKRARKVLTDCLDLQYSSLRTLFADERIQPWRSGLPQPSSGHAQAMISYLHNQHRRDTQENALKLFLWVASDQFDEMTSCHQQLRALADELR